MSSVLFSEERFQLVKLVQGDIAAVAGSNTTLCWPCFAFDKFNDMNSFCSQFQTDSDYCEEYKEECRRDSNTENRKVAYLLGEALPLGSRRSIYDPHTQPMDGTYMKTIARSKHYETWMKAYTQGLRLSGGTILAARPDPGCFENAVSDSTNMAIATRPANAISATTRPAAARRVTPSKRAAASLPSDRPLKKRAKSAKTVGNSKRGSNKTSKKQRASGNVEKAASQELSSNEAHDANRGSENEKIKTRSVLGVREMNTEIIEIGEAEKKFYRFNDLWRKILMPKERWRYMTPTRRSVNLETWWYLKPGSSKHNAIEGRDFIRTPEGVIKYCQENKYYEKYGNLSFVGDKNDLEDNGTATQSHDLLQPVSLSEPATLFESEVKLPAAGPGDENVPPSINNRNIKKEEESLSSCVNGNSGDNLNENLNTAEFATTIKIEDEEGFFF